MRLLQLARKLGVTQSDITEILLKNNIQIEGSNAKIDEESVGLIMKHFGKTDDTHPQEDTQEIEVAEKPEPTEKVEEDITPKIKVTPDVPKIEITEEEMAGGDEEQLANTKKPTETEVIRAKKIKLEGIKVLGKIELPEPVKKEKKEEETEAPEKSLAERKTRQPRESRGRDKGRKPYRKQKKAETFEQKQKRLEREALKKKKEKEKKLKKKKKQYYEQTIKAEQQKPVTKSKKKKKKTVVEPVQKKKKVVYHKNPIKRLWAWLNGKYD